MNAVRPDAGVAEGSEIPTRWSRARLPPGVKVGLAVGDGGSPNPDKTKQVAQELDLRGNMQMLTGLVFTPNAFAIAPRGEADARAAGPACSQRQTLAVY